MRNRETGTFLFFFPHSFFFQTFFDSFFYINKMKNLVGKMPNDLLKAVLMHQLEFSRSLGYPKCRKSRIFLYRELFFFYSPRKKRLLLVLFTWQERTVMRTSFYLPNLVTGKFPPRSLDFNLSIAGDQNSAWEWPPPRPCAGCL